MLQTVNVEYSLILLTYKIATLSAGVFIIYLGYRLFVKGVFVESGDVNLTFHEYKLLIKKAAPGAFFTLFGTLMICFTINKGFSIEEAKQAGNMEKPPLEQKPIVKDTTQVK